MLNLADSLSAFIAAEPSDSIAKRIAVVSTPRATLTAACALAYLHFVASNQLPAPAVITTAVTATSTFAKISPVTGASAAILIHGGISITMPILERIMQPLIKASEARGEARGRAQGEARGRAQGREAASEEFERWKQDQLNQGAVFIDTEPEADESEAGEPPAKPEA